MAKISAMAETQNFKVVATQHTYEKGAIEPRVTLIFFGFENPYASAGESDATLSTIYYMNEAKITLIRDGKMYTKENDGGTDCRLNVDSNKGDEICNANISLSVFKQVNYPNLDTSYSRKAGDIVIVEGTWLSKDSAYSITFEKFMVTIGEDTTDMTISDPYAMEMVSGASIRLNSEKKGLRFAATLGSSYDKESTYHVMIVPKSYLDHFDITDDYYKKLRAALEEAGMSTYIATMEAVPFQYESEEIQKSNGQLQEGVWYIRGSLTSVKAENMATEFFGIAYRIDKAGNYHYASFQEGQNVRSLAGVAQRALEDTLTQYSDEEISILEEYASYAE